MRKLIFGEGGGSKFWEGEVEGSTLRIRFGKTGTAGQTQEKLLASPEAAQKELARRAAEKLGKGYRELGDAGHPFRFYGAEPQEWDEGSNLGYALHLQFRTAPAAGARAAIEAAFEEAALAGGAIELGGWEWNAEWATLTFGDDAAELHPTLWKSVRDGALSVHAVAPLVQAVNANTTEASDAWTTWSYAQGEPGAPPAKAVAPPPPAPAAPPPRPEALETVVRLVGAKPGSPAAARLPALTGGDPAAVLGALIALNDVAAAAGDGDLYHAVLFALAPFDDDAAWACLSGWLAAWRAANAPDNPGSPLEPGVRAILRTGPAARAFGTLEPHVADHRDGKGPRPIAVRALREADAAALAGVALDPRWGDLAWSMVDAPGDLAVWVRNLVALVEHPARIERLLARVDQGKGWPSMYLGLGQSGDPRAEDALRRVLGGGADADALAAARGIAGRADRTLGPLALAAVIRVIERGGKNGIGVWAIREAVLPLATAADAPRLLAAAKAVRASGDWPSPRTRSEYAKEIDALAKALADM